MLLFRAAKVHGHIEYKRNVRCFQNVETLNLHYALPSIHHLIFVNHLKNNIEGPDRIHESDTYNGKGDSTTLYQPDGKIVRDGKRWGAMDGIR